MPHTPARTLSLKRAAKFWFEQVGKCFECLAHTAPAQNGLKLFSVATCSFHQTSRYTGYRPRLCFNGMAGFETSFRPYLLIYGRPCHPDVTVRYSLGPTNKKIHDEDFFFI